MQKMDELKILFLLSYNYMQLKILKNFYQSSVGNHQKLTKVSKNNFWAVKARAK